MNSQQSADNKTKVMIFKVFVHKYAHKFGPSVTKPQQITFSNINRATTSYGLIYMFN